MSEYAHCMGNALGNFREYWDVFRAHPALSGGCVWDWYDQTVRIETDRIGPDGTQRGVVAASLFTVSVPQRFQPRHPRQGGTGDFP